MGRLHPGLRSPAHTENPSPPIERMPTFLSFLLRVFLLLGGLLFAASLAVAFVLMAAAWGVRVVWARLDRQAGDAFHHAHGPACRL